MNEHLQWLRDEQNKWTYEYSSLDRYFCGFRITFKDKTKYLTEYGWGTGTECWVIWLNVYNKVNVAVCRADFDECCKEAADRIKRYLSGDDKWWQGINQEQINKFFGKQ